jgi:hypothetical protein
MRAAQRPATENSTRKNPPPDCGSEHADLPRNETSKAISLRSNPGIHAVAATGPGIHRLRKSVVFCVDSWRWQSPWLRLARGTPLIQTFPSSPWSGRPVIFTEY